MSTKKFIIKTIAKLIVITILSVICITLIQSPVISNQVALGQMDNDDRLFILMEMYNKVRPVIDIVYGCIVGIIVGSIIYDIYKFIKFKYKNYNKET